MLRSGVLLVICVYIQLVSTRGSFRWFRSGLRDVRIEGGVIRGGLADDGDYYAFLGVPYAEPPTGKNRFKAPLPIYQWDGTFEANRIVKCPQNGVGEEDCLVVNIFTPLKILNGPLPVLVYIHGGSFLTGSAPIRGVDPLINQNIIVVTVNYRLGALGFLCLGIEEAPGNAGLKDQVAALQWVNKNIAHFGGDPDNVTIYGMSAGGASVEFQILSQMGKGLFKRAAVESGSAAAVWTTAAEPIATAMKVAGHLDFPQETKNLFKLVAYYQEVPADQLSKVNFEYYTNLTDGTFGFVPCVEVKLPETEADAFMTESAYDVLKKGNYDKVPMMFLFSTLEGLFLRSEEYYKLNYKERMESNFQEFLPADLVFDTTEIRNHIAKNVKNFYFGDKSIDDDTIIEYLNYFGDSLIMHGLLNSVQIHSKDNNPVYLMEFAYKGNMGSNEQFYENVNIAGHGDVIKHAILRHSAIDTNDKVIIERVAKLIANFVKFGNPTPNRTMLLPVPWPLVQPGNVSCLYLDKEFEVIEEPHWGNKVFWDSLYAKFRRRIVPVVTGLL